jgi:transcriptional regulator with XRE-family HTH domain
MTRVEALRRAKQLSLTDAAVLSGLDRTTIHRIEKGRTKPRRSTVVALARGLGVSSRRLWDLAEADWADRVLAEHDAREPVA